MRILAIDSTLVGQSELAKRIESFDDAEQESLDLSVHLASPESCFDRLREDVDVVILGSGLGERAPSLAREIKEHTEAAILLFVSDSAYGGSIFRQALAARVRKVMPERASNLDLLQELVSVHEELCSVGRMKRGKVIAVTHAKGGVGATTLSAALAEAMCARESRTVLWDLDIEGLDLSRALAVPTGSSPHVQDWISGVKNPNRADLADSLQSISPFGAILVPPSDLIAAMDMVGHPDLVSLSQRIVSLMRFSYENVIIDTAGRISPTTAGLMKTADIVLVVVDDSLLGLTAIEPFLAALRSITGDRKLYLVGSGIKLSTKTLASHAQVAELLGPAALSLPSVPFDSKASRWPGERKTLYSLGGRKTREAIDELVTLIDQLTHDKVVQMGAPRDRKGKAESVQREESVVLAKSASGFLSRLRFALW